MKLRCTRYPSLWLPKHNVRFQDGAAEVSTNVAKKILAVSPWVVADEPEAEAEGKSEIKPNKKRNQ